MPQFVGDVDVTLDNDNVTDERITVSFDTDIPADTFISVSDGGAVLNPKNERFVLTVDAKDVKKGNFIISLSGKQGQKKMTAFLKDGSVWCEAMLAVVVRHPPVQPKPPAPAVFPQTDKPPQTVVTPQPSFIGDFVARWKTALVVVGLLLILGIGYWIGSPRTKTEADAIAEHAKTDKQRAVEAVKARKKAEENFAERVAKEKADSPREVRITVYKQKRWWLKDKARLGIVNLNKVGDPTSLPTTQVRVFQVPEAVQHLFDQPDGSIIPLPARWWNVWPTASSKITKEIGAFGPSAEMADGTGSVTMMYNGSKEDFSRHEFSTSVPKKQLAFPEE